VRLEAGTWLGPRCPKTGAKGDAPNRTHAAAGVHLAAALGKSAWVLVRFDVSVAAATYGGAGFGCAASA
ncbi:MAG TPA: hypothetical protein VK822_20260, partial [Acetobacteraceae bacterium]|nr:hypothetical protein [Acetobacteraceae bacterium]